MYVGARDGALMVWDARCQAQSCQRSGTAFQGPVLTVAVKSRPPSPPKPCLT